MIKLKFDYLSLLRNISISRICGFLLFCSFIVPFQQRISKVIGNKNDTCLTAYDGFGYYSYLPGTFIYDDLSFTEWPDSLQKKYCDSPVYQYHTDERGNKINIYHMGLSFVEAPSFLIGHLFAKLSSHPEDGMSPPYQIAYLINALFFIGIGIFYLRKLLLLFFKELVVCWILIVCYTASNVYTNFTLDPSLTHLYLFALNAAFIYFTIRYYNERKFKLLLISAIIFGLTTCIRPTQVVWGLIPFFMFFFENKEYLKNVKRLLLYPAFSLVWNIPQIIYWKTQGDSWLIMNLHSETFAFSDPRIMEFLFSFKKGWLLYTPLFLFIPFGFKEFRRAISKLLYGSIILLFVSVYIFSSWECWWFAESYGSRVMQELYPVLCLFLGFIITRFQNNKLWTSIAVSISLLLIIHNVIQSVQYHRGIIHGSRMTKDHYQEYFLETRPVRFDQSLLEINRDDTSWVSTFRNDSSLKSHTYGYELKSFKMNLPTLSVDITTEDEFKGKWSAKVYDLVPNDEAKIDISYTYETTEKNNPVLLVVTIKSNDHSYFYKTFEMNDAQKSHHFSFNLPNIRHKYDEIEIYCWNLNKSEGKLSKVKMGVNYLVR